MADTKISALTALAAADVDTAADVLAIVDTGATATKKITVDNLRTAMGPQMGTEQDSTSGTSIDFTGVPSWAKRITITLESVSTNGASPLLIQIGDSGGVEATGYLGSSLIMQNAAATAGANYTTGFGIHATNIGNSIHGAITLTLKDSAEFTWVASGTFGLSSSTAGGITAGSKSLSAALDRIRLTTVNGTDTFDAGSVNVVYE